MASQRSLRNLDETEVGSAVNMLRRAESAALFLQRKFRESREPKTTEEDEDEAEADTETDLKDAPPAIAAKCQSDDDVYDSDPELGCEGEDQKEEDEDEEDRSGLIALIFISVVSFGMILFRITTWAIGICKNDQQTGEDEAEIAGAGAAGKGASGGGGGGAAGASAPPPAQQQMASQAASNAAGAASAGVAAAAVSPFANHLVYICRHVS